MLALSRVEHGELEIADERVDLVELLRQVVEAHAGERDVSLDSTLESAFVRGDAERLRQVFDNLLRNALKYSPAGEPVRVEIDADGDEYRVRVIDRGIGIAPEDLKRLFGRFVRGQNARRAKIAGTGIGLFIVKTIVERHGGRVAVESDLDRGSTFTVVLPSAQAKSSQKPMRVSIVSGDAGLRRFAAYELRSRGYRVRECAGLDELSHQGDLRPGDVVLVDPAAAGAGEVRKFGPNGTLRVIGLGAQPGKGDWDGTLPLPFLVSDLVTAVEVPA